MAKDKKSIVSGKQGLDARSYMVLLQELKSILTKGQYAAYKAVDNIRVQTYWQLGERIAREELKHRDRADYGKYLIYNLAVDLGIKRQRLYEFVQFYRAYKIVRSVSGQLSWTHYRVLIAIEEDKKRAFYQNQAILHSWSVRELRKKIKTSLYEKTPSQEIEEVFKTRLPAIVDTQAVFKNSYDFQFIELHPQKKEKDLEDKILSNIEPFLKELGEDFCFIGRQAPIKIGGETHHVDLVLYNKAIPCNVLVDLKIGKLKDSDITQMNKYVSYYRRHKQYVHEKDSIGLIICREANKEIVSYALDGLEEKIFIREYKVKLPSEEKIKKAIKKL
jgi:predicted nuclease of restriction endonuclease-like (RecB) superfamily